MAAFWDTEPWSLVQIDRRFRGAYFIDHQGDKGHSSLKRRSISPRIRLSRCILTAVRNWNLCQHFTIPFAVAHGKEEVGYIHNMKKLKFGTKHKKIQFTAISFPTSCDQNTSWLYISRLLTKYVVITGNLSYLLPHKSDILEITTHALSTDNRVLRDMYDVQQEAYLDKYSITLLNNLIVTIFFGF
jgi:hypothetical protein